MGFHQKCVFIPAEWEALFEERNHPYHTRLEIMTHTSWSSILEKYNYFTDSLISMECTFNMSHKVPPPNTLPELDKYVWSTFVTVRITPFGFPQLLTIIREGMLQGLMRPIMLIPIYKNYPPYHSFAGDIHLVLDRQHERIAITKIALPSTKD